MKRTCPPPTPPVLRPDRLQCGATLIEGLIAIVIFGFAVLGMVGLQANMMRYNSNAQIRAQASFYAEQLLGLAMADPGNVRCYTVGNLGPCGSAVAAAMVSDWEDLVLADLPGASSNLPEATYDAATRRFRLVIRWQREQEDTMNNLTVETVVQP